MKIFVQVSVAIDPILNLKLDQTTRAIQPEAGDTLYRIDPTGRLGVEMALNVRGAEITAIAFGEENRPALIHAFASGAHHALLLLGRKTTFSLSEWLKSHSPDLVIGERPIAVAAAKLGWVHLSGIETFQVEGTKLKVLRGLPRGDREELEAETPACLRLSGACERYVARGRLKNVQKEIRVENLGAEDGRVETSSLSLPRARTRLGENQASPAVSAQKTAKERLEALMQQTVKTTPVTNDEKIETPENMADTFVRYLAHNGLLDLR